MATYYWVGGNGTWNSSATANWSLSSGGAGGAGVPTLADDVRFDASSGTSFNTVTIVTGAVCNNFLYSAAAVIGFNGSGSTLETYGFFRILSSTPTGTFDVDTLLMQISTATGISFISAVPVKNLTLNNVVGTQATLSVSSDITCDAFNTTTVSVVPTAVYAINCKSFQLGFSSSGIVRTLGSVSNALTINLTPATATSGQNIYNDNWSSTNDSIVNTTMNVTPNTNTNVIYSRNTSATKELDVNVSGGTTIFDIQGMLVKNLVLTNAAVRLDQNLEIYGNTTLVGTASVFDSATSRNVLLQKKVGSPNVSRTVTVPSTAQWTKAGLRNLISTGTDTVTISGAFGTSVNPVLDFWTGGASVGAGPVYAENVRLSNGASLSSTVFYVNTNFTIIASSTLTGTYTVNTDAALLNPNGVLVPNLNIVGFGSPAYLTTNLSVTNLSITASSSTGGLYVLNGSSVAIGGTFTLAGSSLVNNVEFKAFAYAGTPLPFSVTKSSGLVNALFATIAYSNASGGATFQALETNGCVDGGNNTGWIFKQAAGNFFLFI